MNKTWAVALLLFVSGLCALVYQTVWMREFRLIFGSSTLAGAAVLAIFMGGLGAERPFLGNDRMHTTTLFVSTECWRSESRSPLRSRRG